MAKLSGDRVVRPQQLFEAVSNLGLHITKPYYKFTPPTICLVGESPVCPRFSTYLKDMKLFLLGHQGNFLWSSSFDRWRLNLKSYRGVPDFVIARTTCDFPLVVYVTMTRIVICIFR